MGNLDAHRGCAHPHVSRPAKEGLKSRCLPMGIRCRKTGRISARPAGCTEETLHQFALLKKRRENLADSNVRRFSDCALHDMPRDKPGVECYPVPARDSQRSVSDRPPRECGASLRVETSGIHVRTKICKDRHRRGPGPSAKNSLGKGKSNLLRAALHRRKLWATRVPARAAHAGTRLCGGTRS